MATLQDRRAVEPAAGVKKHAPDDINPNSIMNHAAPLLDEIEDLPQSMLSTILENFDQIHVEKRITLLARLIIEDALWNREGLTRKERADIAFNAIRVLEGSKSTLWVQDPNDKNIPKNKEAMAKEKDKIESRLQRLLKSGGMIDKAKKQAAADAIKFVEIEKDAI